MNRVQSFHKETALIIAQQMTRDATISCMNNFDPASGRVKVSGEKVYYLKNGGWVLVECYFDGLNVVISWYDNSEEMITRDNAINAIAGNICSMTS